MAVAPLVSRWMERLLAGLPQPMTVGQYLVLRAAAEGEVLAAELARAAGVSEPAVSQLVGGLEADGLVERRRSDADRRRFPVLLTAAGRSRLAAADAALDARLAELLAPLPRPEADALARALPKVAQVLSGRPPPRRPPGPPRPPHRS
jgi:DNA-binding MarR family transcriptional regulator